MGKMVDWGLTMIHRVLAKILVSAVALWAADQLLGGFAVMDGIQGLIIAGVVLGLLNMIVRPILKLVTFPLILVTFGLFTIVINAAMLRVAADLTGLISIVSLPSLFLATLIVSAAHIIFDTKS